MKKFLSLVLAMAMIMSTLVAVTIMPAVAAEPALQSAKTWTLDGTNCFDNEVFTLAHTSLGGWSNVFDGKYTEADGVNEVTDFDGSALYAGSTKIYEVKDGKLHAFSYGDANSATEKAVIVFTAPSYGTYSFGFNAHLNGGGIAEVNGWRKSNAWNECKAAITWTEEGENTASATFVSTHEDDLGATTITMTPGQKIAFSVAANALAPSGYVDVDLSITVTFNGSEGKAFNFVSNGTDSHGAYFGLYGTASNGVSDLVALKVTGAQAGTHSFTGDAGTGYYPEDGSETSWALAQGNNMVVPAPLGTGAYETSAVVVKFTAPADGTYALNVNGALWGGANYAVQLWGDNGRITSVKLPDNTPADTDFGKVTLVAGESVYFRFCGFGAGFTISGISATYVAGTETDIGYVASILPAEQVDIAFNSNVLVKLNVNKAEGATITNFASAEFKLTYDKNYFEFNEAASDLGTAKYKIVEGETLNTLIVEDYGSAKAFGDAYTLAFKGTVATEGADPATTAITLTEAAFSRAVDAEKSDLTDATLVNTVVNVGIKKERFEVTLDPADFFGTSGDAIKGESFTITEINPNYNYTNVVITMNGVTLTEDDYTYENGAYTIAAVTGPITVTGTVTEKVHNVTITGKTESNDGATATYNTDYTFTIPEDIELGDTTDGYTYTVTSVTVNGQDIRTYVTNEGRVYTIPGSYITGEVAIVVTEEITYASNVTLTFEGQSGVVTNKPAQIEKNEDYTFTIDNPTPGYNFAVSYKVGDTDKGTLTPDENGVYTIPGADVTAAVTITITATVKKNIEVHEFLTLNNATMYLVVNKEAKLENNTYAIYGSTIAGVKSMFWSDKYEGYCYLVVIEGEETAAPVAEDFNLTVVNGAATVVHAEGDLDVNKTGVIDINDAQLVYNMYNAKAYTGFTSNVTVEKFLRADLNDVVGIDSNDALVVVSYLIPQA